MTIAFRPNEVGPMFRELGVPVTIGGTPGRAIVIENDQVIVSNNGRGEVVGGAHTITVEAAAFPAIKNGMTVLCDGSTYTIRQRVAESDAAQAKFLLGSV